MKNANEHSMGAFEAKTHFSKLLDRVERGETITITRHGQPSARLVPIEQSNCKKIETAVNRLKRLRGTMRGVGIEELIETIHEGHRY